MKAHPFSRAHWLAAAGLFACAAPESAAPQLGRASLELAPVIVAPRVTTPPLPSYDDAPRSVDADDPAIWVNRKKHGEARVIVALKDAGLAVYDLNGKLEQAILPPNRPALLAGDPPSVGPQPEPGTEACLETESGETYGRYNNVDVQYGFVLRDAQGKKREVDIAVVTDRGCDRLRVYEIDAERPEPLRDITAEQAERVFPERFVQPWWSSEAPRVEANPLDDQSTAYGLTLARLGHGRLHAFVTQRSRAVVAELRLVDAGGGRVGYQRVRELRFPTRFALRDEHQRRLSWTPCREDAADDPQLEGLVFDAQQRVLYAAQEVVGLWKIPHATLHERVVTVPPSRLMERVKSFGAPYWALPDDDEFACQGEPPAGLPEGTQVQPGSDAHRGQFLEADAEGLAIYYGKHGQGYLIASSQGDDTFHVYQRGASRHLGSFRVQGAGETDGHEVVNVPAGARYPRGLFVLQNGKAQAPADTSDIGGFEYDGSSQFMLLGWEQVAEPLDLLIAPHGHDPRHP